ncbi:hypothetical protein FACS1894139_03630 [Planctomycetales bacterium]|nr:hypothetical protein FACS1894107_16950 [Planctomycetales bacterium]GHS97734.1 hypothetical protein FACS1894108_04610 [Planctomycetales bacterium]GHT03414.1 hypothetical protein FACS1894139_03630 [Planctomycetales bacterium]GHV19129.1 hypothetical protein AGMMS49959_03110 [Planctomycetales bacterium]
MNDGDFDLRDETQLDQLIELVMADKGVAEMTEYVPQNNGIGFNEAEEIAHQKHIRATIADYKPFFQAMDSFLYGEAR